MARPQRVSVAMFDFDGTLCDTEGANLLVMQDVLARLGARLPIDELIETVGGNDHVTLPPILSRHGLSVDMDAYDRLLDNCYASYSEGDLEPVAGAVDFLVGLREEGIATALVSTSASRCILTALNRMGMTSLFDAVVCGDMVSARKPSPEPYLQALCLLGASAGEAVVFEDSPTGIAAGKAAGCHVVGCRVAKILQDVSGADEVIDTFVGLSL